MSVAIFFSRKGRAKLQICEHNLESDIKSGPKLSFKLTNLKFAEK